MPTIGQIFMDMRAMAPDLPDTIAPPSSVSLVATSGNLPAGLWYVAVTYLNSYGETLATEGSLTLAGTGGIIVSTPSEAVGLLGANIYIGQVSGFETNMVPNVPLPYTLTALPPARRTIPRQNTAFDPETDGPLVTVWDLYRWLNDGLDVLSRMWGGVLDYAGCPSVYGQGNYYLPTPWMKLANIWYDGWPVPTSARLDIFQYDAVVGIPVMAAENRVSETQMFEIWPQANRTSLQTTLSAAMGIADTVANVNSVNGALTKAVMMIGGPPSSPPLGPGSVPFELCMYTVTEDSGGTIQFQNLRRGVGGTQAQAWPNGTNVQECNIMVAGLRMARHYYYPDTHLELQAPPSWKSLLVTYLLHRYRESEQNFEMSQVKLKEFLEMAAAEMATKRLLHRGQMRPYYGLGVNQPYPIDNFGFGVFIP